jgi:hypothetical protein
MPLAFEFVDAHPQFYKAFVTDLFTAQYHANHGAINCHVIAGGRNWGEGDLKYLRMFMQLDIKKYSEGKIKQADFASFFEITTKSNSYVYQDVDALQVKKVEGKTDILQELARAEAGYMQFCLCGGPASVGAPSWAMLW